MRAPQIFGGLAALTLFLSACGDEPSQQVSTDEDPLEAFQAATEQTAESDDAYRMSMRLDIGETDDPCAALFDFGDFGLDLDVISLVDPVALRATDPTLDETAIAVEGHLYVPATIFGDDVSSPTPWIAVDADTVGYDALQVVSPSIGGFAPIDSAEEVPAPEGEPDSLEAILDELRESATSVTEVGREDVRGESTIHYRIEGGSVLFSDDTTDDTTTPTDLDLDFEAPEETVDAWVDDGGYVARLTVTTPGISTEDLGEAGALFPLAIPQMTMAFETWDHGADIAVEAPAADEVTPASQIDFSAIDIEPVEPDVPDECMPDFGDLPMDEGRSVDIPEGFSYHLTDATDAVRSCFTDAGIAFEEAGDDVGGIFVAVPTPDAVAYDAYLDCLIALETPTTTD